MNRMWRTANLTRVLKYKNNDLTRVNFIGRQQFTWLLNRANTTLQCDNADRIEEGRKDLELPSLNPTDKERQHCLDLFNEALYSKKPSHQHQAYKIYINNGSIRVKRAQLLMLIERGGTSRPQALAFDMYEALAQRQPELVDLEIFRSLLAIKPKNPKAAKRAVKLYHDITSQRGFTDIVAALDVLAWYIAFDDYTKEELDDVWKIKEVFLSSQTDVDVSNELPSEVRKHLIMQTRMYCSLITIAGKSGAYTSFAVPLFQEYKQCFIGRQAHRLGGKESYFVDNTLLRAATYDGNTNVLMALYDQMKPSISSENESITIIMLNYCHQRNDIPLALQMIDDFFSRSVSFSWVLSRVIVRVCGSKDALSDLATNIKYRTDIDPREGLRDRQEKVLIKVLQKVLLCLHDAKVANRKAFIYDDLLMAFAPALFIMNRFDLLVYGTDESPQRLFRLFNRLARQFRSLRMVEELRMCVKYSIDLNSKLFTVLRVRILVHNVLAILEIKEFGDLNLYIPSPEIDYGFEIEGSEGKLAAIDKEVQLVFSQAHELAKQAPESGIDKDDSLTALVDVLNSAPPTLWLKPLLVSLSSSPPLLLNYQRATEYVFMEAFAKKMNPEMFLSMLRELDRLAEEEAMELARKLLTMPTEIRDKILSQLKVVAEQDGGDEQTAEELGNNWVGILEECKTLFRVSDLKIDDQEIEIL